jgi:peptidoglycan/xylan/chitin deacetylase (PgdA/CDA1 family)
VVLTYDDGPHPQVTPALLEALARAEVSATFFVLLTRARQCPDLLQAISGAGCEIGLHGPDRTRLIGLPPSRVRAGSSMPAMSSRTSHRRR